MINAENSLGDHLMNEASDLLLEMKLVRISPGDLANVLFANSSQLGNTQRWLTAADQMEDLNQHSLVL